MSGQRVQRGEARLFRIARAGYNGTSKSPVLNGIVSLPQKQADGFLAMTNVSKNQVTAHISVGSKDKDVLLYARQTRLLKLNEEFSLHAPAVALVKVTRMAFLET